MTEKQRAAAQRRFVREHHEICLACGGSGLTTRDSITVRAKKGGRATYLSSTRPDRPSMSQRGRRGGRPREITLAEVLATSDPCRSHPTVLEVGA